MQRFLNFRIVFQKHEFLWRFFENGIIKTQLNNMSGLVSNRFRLCFKHIKTYCSLLAGLFFFELSVDLLFEQNDVMGVVLGVCLDCF